MERRCVILSLSLLLTVGCVIPAEAQDRGDLAGLARIRSGLTTKRISSYDRTGGNNDRFENIKPGDDMIFIDGDETPTLHGTGTEDYFNTSWCPKVIYNHPYFGYARVNDDLGWLGRTHVYRFHISDPLYFEKSLKFTIEHGHNNCLTLDLASVAYWYQAAPGAKLPPAPDKASRRPKRFIQPADIHRWRHEWRKSRDSEGKLWGNER